MAHPPQAARRPVGGRRSDERPQENVLGNLRLERVIRFAGEVDAARHQVARAQAHVEVNA